MRYTVGANARQCMTGGHRKSIPDRLLVLVIDLYSTQFGNNFLITDKTIFHRFDWIFVQKRV